MMPTKLQSNAWRNYTTNLFAIKWIIGDQRTFSWCIIHIAKNEDSRAVILKEGGIEPLQRLLTTGSEDASYMLKGPYNY